MRCRCLSVLTVAGYSKNTEYSLELLLVIRVFRFIDFFCKGHELYTLMGVSYCFWDKIQGGKS